ncbi:molybdenum ABC transporter ATP-binding protein [Aliiroseovarius subalbicans]|uniref:molybdenum ABC transporter ATP-binding protein n=1 Tax=Aliiroseovarius subalbicans TaxID=2925840 RepID=UPI001F57DB52|nr:molybdenum ABC transporter ATP-binding protein [Aliiroseovarius subalbicans]MCI2399665.1 molybdenum ABC transporter ATP-binding protein [Aliiroseovarius subalbicans]
MSLSVSLQHQFAGLTLDVAFDAPPGVTVLFGKSGTGKTTIINAVAGLLKPQGGRISLDDRVLVDTAQGIWQPPHKRRIGYIFQEDRLFPHLTVQQNLTYGQRFAPKGAPRDALDQVVDLLGIAPLLSRRPNLLSGGEKSRVAIGRAVLSAPDLILADEPLAALDAARKAEIMTYFERLRDEMSTPILYVSHSVAEVARLATTVVAIENGSVARCGPAADTFADPAFLPLGAREAGALLEARVITHHDDGLSELEAGGVPLFLPHVPQAPGRSLRVRIAAQDVTLALDAPTRISALNVLSGRIDTIHAGAGPGAIVSVLTPAGPVLARVTARSVKALDLRPGLPVHAIVKTVSIAPEDVGG